MASWVYAVRAQCTSGSVQVDFTTEEETAVSVSMDAEDSLAGWVLHFENGERVHSIELQLLDDDEPGQAKYLFVNLFNPNGGKFVQYIFAP